MLLGVDVGGTFTDAVLVEDGRIHTAKTPTTPSDQSEGVAAAVAMLLEQTGREASEVEWFAHGMTVGTNALLERAGAATTLIATEGFTDLLEIGRQNRPHLYRLCEDGPAPLADRNLRVAAAERIGPDGVITELSEEELERIADRIAELDPESVAICLLFSYADPSHEQAIAERLAQRFPGLHVSASHEVLARFREYERCSTTTIDAYLSPLLARYLGRLRDRTTEIGLPEPVVMRSSGGVAPLDEAARAGAWSVLSGPAGGAVGAGILARLSGDGNALGFDMGGTSCDVCVIDDGEVRRSDGREIGGHPIGLPMVDVHTVGAGGGSIGWIDEGGALRAGPRSAGADPGPASYGRGGTEPTVTDANLLLGYLRDGATLGADTTLDRDAAERALAELGSQVGLSPTEAAAGVIDIANQEMLRALRVVTVEQGIDPREYALLPFGGSGPMHAAAIADQLDIATIICPRSGGVLSALGLTASERRRDAVRTVLLSGDDLTTEMITAAVEDIAQPLTRGLDPDQITIGVTYHLRYRGQAFELGIEGDVQADPQDLAERFAEAHERRYGYRDDASPVELIDIGVAVTEAGREPEPEPPEDPHLERSTRSAYFDGEWCETGVLRGEPAEGERASGPCVFELPETTLVLPPGWAAEVDSHGSIVARRDDG